MIKAENISYSYSVDQEEKVNISVFENLSLEIEKGTIVALLGHNGSGKSTLVKTFNGIILPKSGSVLVDGLDTKDENQNYEIRKRVGIVFQNPDNQLVATVVEEDVAFGPENLGIEPKLIRRRVDKALGIVDMLSYSSHSPHMLSGGQKQRIAIAGIIAMNPEYIILDESTAMLDPKGRKDVISTVLKLNKEHNMTVVLITHYMEEATLCDRVVVLNKGEVVKDSTPKEVFENVSYMKSLNLGVPETAQICKNLKDSGIDIEFSLTSEEFLNNFDLITEKK